MTALFGVAKSAPPSRPCANGSDHKDWTILLPAILGLGRLATESNVQRSNSCAQQAPVPLAKASLA